MGTKINKSMTHSFRTYLNEMEQIQLIAEVEFMIMESFEQGSVLAEGKIMDVINKHSGKIKAKLDKIEPAKAVANLASRIKDAKGKVDDATLKGVIAAHSTLQKATSGKTGKAMKYAKPAAAVAMVIAAALGTADSAQAADLLSSDALQALDMSSLDPSNFSADTQKALGVGAEVASTADTGFALSDSDVLNTGMDDFRSYDHFKLHQEIATDKIESLGIDDPERQKWSDYYDSLKMSELKTQRRSDDATDIIRQKLGK